MNIAPITALCFLDANTVLVGEGPFLKQFDISSRKCVTSHRVFPKERIHGIRVASDDCLIVWGAKHVLTLSLSDFSKTSFDIESEDWIFSATITESGALAFVTARNELFLAERDAGGVSKARKLAVLSEERCTLYTARIEHYPNENRFLIAAGTVFGEIFVWSASYPGNEGVVQMHYKLEGHAGAVFDLDFTPLLDGRRYLGSCSNDRTVRIWDISNAELVEADGGKESTRAIYPSECLAAGWGHSARIWRVMLIQTSDNNGLTVISSGEDLKANVWDFSKDQGEWTLQLKEEHQLHSGKSVWSIDVLPEKNLLLTGGADGQVALINYSTRKAPLEMHISALLDKVPPTPIPEGLSEVEIKKLQNIKKNFAQYSALDHNRLLFTTSLGHIFLYTISADSWDLLQTWTELKNFSVLSTWKQTNFAAIGDSNNKISIVDISQSSFNAISWVDSNCKRLGEFFTGRLAKES